MADSSVSYLRLQDLNLEKSLANKYQWKTGIFGETYEEGANKEIGSSASLDVKLTRLLSKNLYLNFKGGIGYSTSNSQLSISEFYSDSFFNVSDVTLNLLLGNNIKISAGNIGQNYLKSSMLLSGGRSFPGLKQELSVLVNKHKLGVIAQESIPTSKSFNIDREEKEGVPSLLIGSLFANLDFKSPITLLPTSRLKWNTSLSYFQFDNLPNVVAQKGRLYGHLFVDGKEAESKFAFDFSGYLINTEFKFEDKNNYEFGVAGYWADNLKAETNDRLENIKYFVSKTYNRITLDASIETFFKDSEVSPAVYSTNSYGRNNREGQAYGLGVEFSKYKFRVEAKYYDIDTVVDNSSVQNKRENFYLGVETLYVKF